MIRRHAVFGLGALLAATLAPGLAAAQQGFPSKPIRFIVPFPGGGTNDVLARIIADKLSTKWGQTIVVENKTGAGGNIGADLAAQAEPDGHTLFVSPPGPLAVNQNLYKQLSYKPEDFVPITVLGAVPNVVMVRKDLPANSVPELVAYIKANPGKVTFGSQGNGSTPHLTGMMFQNMTGTHMVHVPYRGENLVLNDMIGGHVDVFFGNVAAAMPFHKDNKVRLLAVTDKTRFPGIPEVSTAAEVGLPNLIAIGWFAVAAPPKMPPVLQTQIAKDVIEVVKLPDVQAKFRAIQIEPVGNTPAEMAVFLKEETKRWGDVIRQNGIVVD
jgi:tripartite-type tricarboxylate transporter receptor subunit TctC